VAVFVYGLSQGSDILDGGGGLGRDLALFAPLIEREHEYWRLVTSGFLHYGIIHLGFNMLVLARMGETLETGLGKLRFSALYLAALLAGSFGALVAEPFAFTAGASGAVYGLFGALALGLRSRGLSVWQSGIGPLIAINLLLTFTIPSISIGGHIGGLVGGGLCALGLFGPSAIVGRQTGKRPSVLVGMLSCTAVAVLATVGALAAAATA
jgi:membrane associated rhomboid family serine protease